jgi:hypothetical protein
MKYGGSQLARARTRHGNCLDMETIPTRDVATVVKFQHIQHHTLSNFEVLLLNPDR